jgi:hypothetical protein
LRLSGLDLGDLLSDEFLQRRQSRLAEALRYVFDLRERCLGWEAARSELEVRYGHYSFAHTINNAAVGGSPDVGRRRLRSNRRTTEPGT